MFLYVPTYLFIAVFYLDIFMSKQKEIDRHHSKNVGFTTSCAEYN